MLYELPQRDAPLVCRRVGKELREGIVNVESSALVKLEQRDDGEVLRVRSDLDDRVRAERRGALAVREPVPALEQGDAAAVDANDAAESLRCQRVQGRVDSRGSRVGRLCPDG